MGRKAGQSPMLRICLLVPPYSSPPDCTDLWAPSQDGPVGGAVTGHRRPYHCAAVVEVMLVLVGVGTEVHAGRDPREGPPFLQPQAAVDRYFLIGHLCGWPRRVAHVA